MLQRRVCEALYTAEDQDLPLQELRRQLGEPDRSNLRRAIRRLLERDLVQETRSKGKCRLGLILWGYLFASSQLELRRPPVSLRTRWIRETRALKEAWEAECRRRKAEAERPRWFCYEHRFVRNRLPGPTQKRMLYVLWEYPDPLNEGLPVTAVKAIVGEDRSNTRRAFRTLLLRGKLDESGDGERIRFSSSTASWFRVLPPILLLDEVGRGTSTYDGMSLAWAIAEYLHDDVQALTLFATHYHELTRLAEMLPGCRNQKATVEEIGGEIVFLHRIEEGAESSSYGVHVARLAGLPPQVTDRAGEILSRLESEGVKDFAG
jgi:hypothetical protein